MGEAFITRRGGGTPYAVIGVTYPSGSVCTCSNGSVTLTAKPQDRTGRDALNRPTAVDVPGFTFPGVLTEKYFRNDAEDVYRAELQQRVLVTPKVIVLRAGDLVQQDTEPPYTVRQVLDLDPYKNEYVIERRWDA